MPWREHLSVEDQRVIEEQPGTASFRQAVKLGFWGVAFEALKRAHPPEDHASLTAMWRSQATTNSPIGRAKNDIAEKIADIMQDLDQRTGSHGVHSAAWMDAKTRELIQYVRSLV